MTRPDDAFVARVRAAYRDLAGEDGAPDAPSDDAVVDLVLGSLTGPERERAADAIAADPELAAKVRALMRVHRESSAKLAPTRRPVVTRIGLAAAAVVALVLGVLAWNATRTPSGSDVLRGGSAVEAAAIRPADGAILNAPPATLSCEPIEGATSYRAVIYDAASSPLWRSPESPSPTFLVPEEVRRRLAEPGTYYWKIAWDAGAEERSLPIAEFRVEPSAY